MEEDNPQTVAQMYDQWIKLNESLLDKAGLAGRVRGCSFPVCRVLKQCAVAVGESLPPWCVCALNLEEQKLARGAEPPLFKQP